MGRPKARKNIKRVSDGLMRLNFELECACCAKRYQHQHGSRRGEFVCRGGTGEKALSIRALLGGPIGPGRRRKQWTATHSELLRIMLEVFGEKHLAVSSVVFDAKEEFLRRKADELAAMATRSPSPAPMRSTPVFREALKETPNLSTADKLGQINPHFTPKPSAIEALRFTPESYYFRQATPSMVYNQSSTYITCKFPDITCEHLWEAPTVDMRGEGKWEPYSLPTPGGKVSLPISPLLISSRVTNLAGFSPLVPLARPVIDRL